MAPPAVAEGYGGQAGASSGYRVSLNRSKEPCDGLAVNRAQANFVRDSKEMICHRILRKNVGIPNTWENSMYSIVNQQLRLIETESSVGNPYEFFGNTNSAL